MGRKPTACALSCGGPGCPPHIGVGREGDWNNRRAGPNSEAKDGACQIPVEPGLRNWPCWAP